MTKPQYGILRFAKYKGPEIGRILKHLLESVIDEKLPNEKDTLLAEALKVK